MKIEISVDKLKEAIGKADKITGKNSTLESLKSILLIASRNSLKVRSTNLSLGLEIEIASKVLEEGEVLVSGEILNNTLQNMNIQDKVINIEKSNENLFLNNKRTKVVIKSLNSEDFPTIPVVEGDSFDIDIQKFMEGVRSVFYSAAISDIKPEIASVYIYSDNDELVFVATDSFRLGEKRLKIKNLKDVEGIIIPYKNILEIIKLLSDIRGSMTVFYNKNQISFVISGLYLTSRLINGAFPDYRQILPKNYKTKAIILKKDLLEAIRLSNVFSDKFNQIKIVVDPKAKIFEVYAVNKDIGENKTIIEGVLEGEKIEMNFNHKYIFDCFQSINEDSVIIEISDSNRPVVVKGNGDKSFLYLIMPMNR